jgi:hypothetical protein
MNNPNTFFVFFILLWIALAVVFSFWGGWRELARYYRYRGQVINKKKYMQSASMRGGMGYRGCLTIGANFEGLYIAVLFLFRAGHPPLFIPWHDIKIKRKTSFGFPMLELTFIQTPSITLTIPQALEGFLQSVTAKPLPFSTTEDTFKTTPARNWFWWLNLIAGIIGVIAAIYAIFFAPHRKF